MPGRDIVISLSLIIIFDEIFRKLRFNELTLGNLHLVI